MPHDLRFLPLIASLLLASTALVGCAKPVPQSEAQVAKLIQSQYDIQSRGYAEKDVELATSVFSPRYEDINYGVSMPLPQFKASLVRLFLLSGDVQLKNTVRSVNVSGNTCIARTDRHLEMRIYNPKTRTSYQFATEETDSDTWVRDATKGWLKRKSVVLSARATKDGVPVESR